MNVAPASDRIGGDRFYGKLIGGVLVAKNERKISETDTLDIVLMRLSGETLDSVAKVFGVTKQTIQYHEGKDLARELREIVLRQAAQSAGDAIGKTAVDKLPVVRKAQESDHEEPKCTDHAK